MSSYGWCAAAGTVNAASSAAAMSIERKPPAFTAVNIPRFAHDHALVGSSPMASITERESAQVEAANASGRTPVVFIHGLWLLPSSWDNWAAVFEEAGYAAVTPVWPDDPETVEEARANPDVLAKKTLGQVADHTAEVIGKLDKKPAVMGHSTGGLLAQMIADRGLSAATVGIDPGPFRGVLPLPIAALRSAGPVLENPLEPGPRRHPHAGPVQVRLGERARATRRRSSSTRPTTWLRPAWR